MYIYVSDAIRYDAIRYVYQADGSVIPQYAIVGRWAETLHPRLYT